MVCDSCNEDFTESEELGGLLFLSRAICPRCLPAWEKSIHEYQEEHMICACARPLETFRAFVLRTRGGNNTIQIGPL